MGVLGSVRCTYLERRSGRVHKVTVRTRMRHSGQCRRRAHTGHVGSAPRKWFDVPAMRLMASRKWFALPASKLNLRRQWSVGNGSPSSFQAKLTEAVASRKWFALPSLVGVEPGKVPSLPVDIARKGSSNGFATLLASGIGFVLPAASCVAQPTPRANRVLFPGSACRYYQLVTWLPVPRTPDCADITNKLRSNDLRSEVRVCPTRQLRPPRRSWWFLHTCA